MKKIVTLLLSTCMLLCVGVCLTACGDKECEHSYTTSVTKPTCTMQGYTTYTCNLCGDSFVGDYAAPNHNDRVWIGEELAVEGVKDGVIGHFECVDCGKKLDEQGNELNSVVLHSFGEWVSARPATCDSEGSVGYYICTACQGYFDADKNELLEETAILPKEEHDYGNDGYCKTCLHHPDETTTLYFSDYDGESYSVGGFGTCTDSDVVIPKIYNGKPVVHIRNFAFQGKAITSVVIPDSIRIPEDSFGIFKDCSSLTSVVFAGEFISIGNAMFENCTSLTSIDIPESVTDIGDDAFKGCSSLTSVTIPDGITVIEKQTFMNCSSLTTINIPNSVTTIDMYAFDGCSSLTAIRIPNSVTAIENGAFQNCSSLTEINIPNGITMLQHDLFAGCSSLLTVIIPNNITEIRNTVFKNCTSLTSIKIPDTVAYIHKDAHIFEGCTSLASITLPVFELSFNAIDYFGSFFGAGDGTQNGNYVPASLKEVIVSSGTKIPSSYFSGCSSIENIIIPDTVTEIGSSAFNRCMGLKSLTVPNSVTRIERSVLYGCTALEVLSVPFIGSQINDHVNRYLGYFFGATSYEENKSTIPATLKCVAITNPNEKVISEKTFYHAKGLETIVLTGNITHIQSAFVDTALSDVFYHGTPEEWDLIYLDDTFVSAAPRHYYSETEPTDTERSYWHYVDGVPTVWTVE